MESILQEHNAQMPTRELLEALAEKFRHVVGAINSVTHILGKFLLAFLPV